MSNTKNKPKEPSCEGAVSGSYASKLTDYEVNKMKELKSNTIRFTSGGGIGVGVECLVNDKWVDITDYNCW